MALRSAGQWGQGKLWGESGWNAYLGSVAAVERAIRYVEGNTEKEGKPRQQWRFVTPFDLQVAMADRRAFPGPNRQPRCLGGAALKSHEEKLRRSQSLTIDRSGEESY
jgi:hypothetical protein